MKKKNKKKTSFIYISHSSHTYLFTQNRKQNYYMTCKVEKMSIFHDSLSSPTLPFCLVLISAPLILAFVCYYLFVSCSLIVCLFFTGMLFPQIFTYDLVYSFLKVEGGPHHSLPQGILNPFTFKINLSPKLCIICFIMYYFSFPLLMASSSREKNVLPTVICLTT